jgi:hypothetical protein
MKKERIALIAASVWAVVATFNCHTHASDGDLTQKSMRAYASELGTVRGQLRVCELQR